MRPSNTEQYPSRNISEAEIFQWKEPAPTNKRERGKVKPAAKLENLSCQFSFQLS